VEYMVLFLVICPFLFIIYASYNKEEAKYRIRRGEYEQGVDAALRGMGIVQRDLLEPVEKKLKETDIFEVDHLSRKERRVIMKYMLYLCRFHGFCFDNKYLRVLANKAISERDVFLLRLAAKISSSSAYEKIFLKEAEEISRNKKRGR